MANPTEPFLRYLRQKGDRFLEELQSRGLHESARLARAALREAQPDNHGWAEWEMDTLEALLEQLCAYEGGDLPGPADCGAVEATREFIDTLPPGRQEQLRDLLAILEVGSLLLGPGGEYRRLTRLSDACAEEYIHSWAASSVPQRRAVFHGIKSVCMMGYWSREQTWPAIGYEIAVNRNS